MDEHKQGPRPAPIGSGNPRITVAFPFAKIQLAEPARELAELAALVRGLAEEIAGLAAEARALAARLGAA